MSKFGVGARVRVIHGVEKNPKAPDLRPIDLAQYWGREGTVTAHRIGRPFVQFDPPRRAWRGAQMTMFDRELEEIAT